MKKNPKYETLDNVMYRSWKAPSQIVKGTIEAEKEEGAEEHKAGTKVRARKSKLALILLMFLFVCTAHAADKHPERKARDLYARQFAAEIEHDGWEVTTFAMRPGCPFLCVNHGNHDCLRIIMNGGTVEAVDRFAAQELKPRIAQMRALGFVEVDILGLQSSHNYPDGMARIPFPPEEGK